MPEALRHARHPLPAVSLNVVDLHRVEYAIPIVVPIVATTAHGVDLVIKHHRGMGKARPAHARHRSPSAELRVVGLDRLQ
eukprot:scaffold36620_cov67-Phaeocystis_antarctica.AAC.2